MVLYFRVENIVMKTNKKTSYYIYRVNSFLLYYRMKNRVLLEHFYLKLYFIIENREELEIPLILLVSHPHLCSQSIKISKIYAPKFSFQYLVATELSIFLNEML